MPISLPFEQVDVFSEQPFQGNALAVVVAADELGSEQMRAFAAWTQLSETTFLLKPTSTAAHYRVRIFTPSRELPFGGHPTLGSCQVWLKHHPECVDQEIVQECSAGLVRICRDGSRLAFAAPPLLRTGALDAETLASIRRGLGLAEGQVRASQWVDNGPGWVAVLLGSREEVLAIEADYAALGDLNVGVLGRWSGPDAEADVEVRAFIGDEAVEDPVTGSLNASLAQWLVGSGELPERYIASQGAAVGRRGRVAIERLGADIWVGGEVQACVSGTVRF